MTSLITECILNGMEALHIICGKGNETVLKNLLRSRCDDSSKDCREKWSPADQNNYGYGE